MASWCFADKGIARMQLQHRLRIAVAIATPPATPPIGVDVGQTLDIYALRSQFSF
jgi:hypothetical protein